MPVCAQCGTDNPDIAKFCLACGSALAVAPPPQEFRKIVTIVFSDLKGSTSMGEKLDSESLREVMTRYFDAMRSELEHHGGVVEKFIGDAIMAVFGLPKLHEDDALRAVRAAADMRRAQAMLNDELERFWGVRLAVRTGVNTGEIVAGDPSTSQRLVTGDAVNVAARLEQAAGEQEILLGDLTYRLVRDYVDVEEVEPLVLKGKAEPVPAYRLVSVREGAERARRLDAPLIGREAELAHLDGRLQEAVASRRCQLITVVGEAGAGKSRLVQEFVTAAEAGGVAFLRGRCLPYGDGITFWPFAEAMRQAAGILERDTTEVALQKLSSLSGDAEAEERVAAAIGLSPEAFPQEELVWGARKVFESLAHPQALLVLFEDVHWAETAFLALLENLVETVEDAQLLVVCTARYELLERQPEWSTAAGMTRIELELLGEDETSAIAEHLLGQAGLDDRIRQRVVQAAEGNPLFVEQLISMLVDDGLIRFEGGRWRAQPGIDRAVVPPTIHALLAARLDHLQPDERTVIEPASVIGQVFVKDAVAHLVPERVSAVIGEPLGALVDKQLVQPDLARSLEEEAFRFHHILIRDTAYEGILKRSRATFHEEFVRWADGVNREGATEYEEILGYHLEQAWRYLGELGPLDDHGRSLGVDASRRLTSAGRRAFVRGDVAAAANLLGRATALLPEDARERIELLPDYGEALLQAGRFEEAGSILGETIERASAADLPLVAAHASLVLLLVRLRAGQTESWRDEAAVTIAGAMAAFEPAGDHIGLAKGWRLLAWTHGTACRFGLTADAAARALDEARLADDPRQETVAAMGYAAAAVFGPTPVSEAIERCEHAVEQVSGDRQSEGMLLALLASLVAMEGSFDRARQLCVRSLAMLEELRLPARVARAAQEAWRVEMLAGDVEAAERHIRLGYDLLLELGEKYLRSTIAGLLGQTLYQLARYEEAELLALESRDLATEDDVDTQAVWRCLLAKLTARRGAFDEAEALALEAIEILVPTDALLLQFGAYLDLAEILQLAGRTEEAQAAIGEALERAKLKQSAAMVAAAERALAAATEESLVS